MIGTPFNVKDEILSRKIEAMDKKPWEQEGRDDQGRKHFYGAFTGALKEFSVGYKGTVGSKEGWAPKEFVSSRADRGNVKQNIFDFMDEDDIGEHLAGSTIQAQKQFDTLGGAESDLLKQSLGKGILGQVPDELIITTNNSKGYQLMKAMGFKDRGSSKFCFKSYESADEEDEFDDDEDFQGYNYDQDDEEENKKVYGVQQMPLNLLPSKRGRKEKKHKKYYDGPITYKSNYNGIGYIPTPNDLEQIEAKKLLEKKQSNRIQMSEFNYQGIEEDDDDDIQMTKVYDTDSKDKYSKSIKDIDQHQFDEPINNKGKKQQQQNPSIDANNQFVFGETLSVEKIGAEKIEVPKNFNPFKHNIQDAPQKKKSMVDQIMDEQSQKFQKKFGHGLDATKRAAILGETPAASSINSRFTASSQNAPHDSMSSHSTNKLIESKYLNFVIDIPFKADLKKMARFKSYVLDIEGQLVTFDVPNNMMTGSQMRLENLEFDKLYKLNKLMLKGTTNTDDQNIQDSKYQRGVYTSKSKNQQHEDIQKKIDELQKKISIREEMDWQPAHLLLTRFGLSDPHEAKKVKPPMYFKNMKTKKSHTDFEKKEILSQMPVSQMAFDDGNDYFKSVQEQYSVGGGELQQVPEQVEELKEENGEDNQQLEKVEQVEQQIAVEQQQIVSLKERPPISLFESIFNDDNDDEDDV